MLPHPHLGLDPWDLTRVYPPTYPTPHAPQELSKGEVCGSVNYAVIFSGPFTFGTTSQNVSAGSSSGSSED